MTPKATSTPFGHYAILGLALLMLAAMYPLLSLGRWGHLAWTVVFWLVLLGCLHVVATEPRVRTVARVLGWIAIAASIASLWCFKVSDGGHGFMYLTIHGVSLVFLLITAGVLLCDVFGQKFVSGQTLLGAACGYVLLGLVFAFAMLVAHSVGTEPLVVHPSIASETFDAMSLYLYFSFVTLSTLGYGDVVPGSPILKVLAPTEAVIGQLYLAMFVARLIALQVTTKLRCPRCDERMGAVAHTHDVQSPTLSSISESKEKN